MLTFDVLEGRDVPSPTLILDFCQPGDSLRRDFALMGDVPALDFDRNGAVNGKDVLAASKEVVRHCRTLLRGTGVTVRGVDFLKNHERDQTVPDTYTVAVGGNLDSVLGVTLSPAGGFNFSAGAFVFPRSMRHLPDWKTATPRQFARGLATTCVHEWMHLLGVGHADGRNRRDIMNPAARSAEEASRQRLTAAEKETVKYNLMHNMTLTVILLSEA